jgi:hypothetical protein
VAVVGDDRPADLPGLVARLPFDLVIGQTLLRRRAPTTQAITDLVDQVFLPLVAHYSHTGDDLRLHSV